MEKISVTVEIPALNGSYDFVVPSSMSVQNAQNLMIRILDSEYGVSGKSTDAMLFDKNDGKHCAWNAALLNLISPTVPGFC